MLPWACRIRPRPCARRSQRALSGCQSSLAARVPDPCAGDDHNVALGSRRPTPKRAPAGHRVAQARSEQRSIARGWISMADRGTSRSHWLVRARLRDGIAAAELVGLGECGLATEQRARALPGLLCGGADAKEPSRGPSGGRWRRLSLRSSQSTGRSAVHCRTARRRPHRARRQ